MNTQKLQVLLTVIDAGSFTKAGDLLGYTQSGITQMMKNLEKEVGFPLFIKNHHGVKPTEECKRILPSIRQLITDDEKLAQEISFINGLEQGSLKIGSFTSCSTKWLPLVLPVFQKQYPNIEISILEGGESDVTQWVYDRTVDIGLLSLPEKTTFEFIPIITDPMVVVLPKGHEFTKYDKIPMAALEAVPFIASDANFDQDVHSILTRHKLHLNVIFTSKNDYTILSMVEHNLGISILPELIVKSFPGNYEIRPLDPEYHRTLGIGISSSADVSPAASMFIKTLKNIIC